MTPQTPTTKHHGSITTLLFAIVSILMIYTVTTIVLVRLGELFIGEQGDYGVTQFLCYTVSFVLTLLYCLALHKRYPAIRIPTLRRAAREINSPLMVGGVILILAFSIVISPVLESMPAEWIESVNSYIAGGFWPMLTAIIAAPLLEELLFRGVIQKSLVTRLGPLAGIALGALIFGAIHIVPQQIIYATGVGLILGTIYYLTGSLVGAITVHFVNNGLTTLLFLMFGTSTGVERQFLGDGALWNFVYFCSSALLVVASVLAVRAIIARKHRDNRLPKVEPPKPENQTQQDTNS